MLGKAIIVPSISLLFRTWAIDSSAWLVTPDRTSVSSSANRELLTCLNNGFRYSYLGEVIAVIKLLIPSATSGRLEVPSFTSVFASNSARIF
jgi:hypothetical protein